MARMIPPRIHPTVRSGAERKLFAVIRNAPGTEDWVCLHSLALARHESKRRGEIDYLLLTRKGVFVLEIKGGRVARQGGVWVFTNRWGDEERKYESPYQQASTAMFSLEKDIQNKFGKDHRLGKLLFGYGVLFPDIVFEDYGTEGDPANTYDLRDNASSFSSFVERLARYSREQDPKLRYAPTEKDIEDLTDFLRGDFDRIPPLGVRLDEVADRLLELTREQYHFLDAYASPAFPRLVIQGGAGTGKTLLSVECAIREAEQTSGRTLFLCYNRLLAAYLNRIIQERSAKNKVEVWSVYAFLNHLIKSSKTFGPEFARRRERQPYEIVYGVLYPEYAGLAVMEGGHERYDTLVVDEGQDFISQPLLSVLDGLLLSGIENGRWRVFCDVNNQGGDIREVRGDRIRVPPSTGTLNGPAHQPQELEGDRPGNDDDFGSASAFGGGHSRNASRIPLVRGRGRPAKAAQELVVSPLPGRSGSRQDHCPDLSGYRQLLFVDDLQPSA